METKTEEKKKRGVPQSAYETLRRKARERHARGEFAHVHMWITLTEDARKATEGMTLAEIGEFVSEAVIREAKRRGMC